MAVYSPAALGQCRGRMNPVWCNGEWLDGRSFAIDTGDRGWTLGLGIFETLLAVDGRAVFAGRHLARLEAGCARFGWAVPLPGGVGELRSTAAELLARAGLARGDARLRLAVSGGAGGLANLQENAGRKVWLAAFPLPEVRGPLAVVSCPWPRNERGPLAGLKCASYAENIVALDHARRSGGEETLWFNTAGQLCEAATANVFLCHGETLRTPPLASGCLPGIAREVVIECARELGISCVETDLSAGDLETADGLFLTSSIRGPRAVARCDGRSLAVPPVSGRLREAWRAAVLASAAGE